MAEGKEIIETHGGFVISVLAIAKSSPHPPGYIAFGYAAMLHRPDADIRMADQKVDISRSGGRYSEGQDAGQAGFDEGRSIIDGTHPRGLTRGCLHLKICVYILSFAL